MIASPRLQELARRPAAPVAAEPERCDLCALPLPPEHRHMLDLETGEPLCTCQACRILFDRGEAGGDHYRLIPQRRVRLDRDALDDRMWAGLGVPVDLAFVTRDSRADAVIVRYPSPVGMTSHTSAPDAWEQITAANPLLAAMEDDVEALLVHRVKGARDHWLVPIDDCFRLAARVRTHWSGFGGGDEVWREIAAFFDELEEAT